MSSEHAGQTVAVKGVLSPADTDVGVANQAQIVDFADAVIARDDAKLPELRSRLAAALGPEALVDAACVVGNFERMNRIADACGISLGMMAVMAGDVREELDIEHMGSAANTKPIPILKRWMMKLMLPFAMKHLLRPRNVAGEE